MNDIKLSEKYKVHEKFIITKTVCKTIRYIERNAISFPSNYKVIKDRIINSSYNILEYRLNVKRLVFSLLIKYENNELK